MSSDIELNEVKSTPGLTITLGPWNLSSFMDSERTDTYSEPNRRNKPALHLNIECFNIRDAKALVQDENVNVNIKDEDGNTPLHAAVKLKQVDVVETLLQRPDLEVNEINAAGQTALHIALDVNDWKIIRFLCSRADIDLDDVKHNGKSCRDRVKKEYANKYLFVLLYHGETGEFNSLINDNLHLLDVNDGDYTYLQYACKMSLTEVVKKLLDIGVNPNNRILSGDLPLFFAAFNGCYKILKLLLEHREISLEVTNGKNVLHAMLYGVKESTYLTHPDKNHDYKQCLKLLLSKNVLSKVKINAPDSCGNTILHLAARVDDVSFVETIMQLPVYIGQTDKKGRNALEFMKSPIIEKQLNYCISTNGKETEDENFAIIFDYGMLVPKKKWKQSLSLKDKQIINAGICETAPLLSMTHNEDLKKLLLQHPLLLSFLHLKWYPISHFFYINTFIHFAFLIYLILHACCKFTPESNCFNNEIFQDDSVLWVFVGILFVREFSQFVILPLRYFRCFENWIEVFLIGTVTMYVSSVDKDKNQIYYAVSAIFITSFETILIFGRHPNASTYVEMFKKVSNNFLYFLFWYSAFIVGVACCFFILFRKPKQPDNEYRTPELSIFKTVVMMAGSLDTKSMSLFEHSFDFHYVLPLLFLFLIKIVLFSLLNGLAFSNIQAIKVDAKVNGRVSLMELISFFENMVINVAIFDFGLCCEGCGFMKRFFTITFFPNLLPDAKAYVFPNRNNAVMFKSDDSFDPNNPINSYCEWRFALKMDPDIVQASLQIIENRNSQSKATNFEELFKQYSHKMNDELKNIHDILEILSKNVNTNMTETGQVKT